YLYQYNAHICLIHPFFYLLLLIFLFPLFFFFFTDPATTEIYTLSLHDALPISRPVTGSARAHRTCSPTRRGRGRSACGAASVSRSEEHTSELQSRGHLVCRLLLEKKKKRTNNRDWVSSE